MRVRDDDRGGTLPGGTLYILDKLWLSARFGGDGVLKDRPRGTVLMPLPSMLFFLSRPLFSKLRKSLLGRLDTTEIFREKSGREALRTLLSKSSLRGIVSAKLGSVSSRISDKGRILAQDVTLTECPLDSPKLLLTMPPQPVT